MTVSLMFPQVAGALRPRCSRRGSSGATHHVAAFLLAAATASGALATNARALEAAEWPPPYHANLTYYVAGGRELKLDLYRAKRNGSHPLVVYFHGGGWMSGSRKEAMPLVFRFLGEGFDVANVDYRLGSEAPAAVEDVRYALYYLNSHGPALGVDRNRMLTAGDSAGAHIALMAAFAPTRGFLDGACLFRTDDKDDIARGASNGHLVSATSTPRVRAVVNLYGISDLPDLVRGPNAKTFARAWLGGHILVRRLPTFLSPLTYARHARSYVVSVHGDADSVVPYAQSIRLHSALSRSGLKGSLIRVRGGSHGDFSDQRWAAIFDEVAEQLRRSGAVAPTGPHSDG